MTGLSIELNLFSRLSSARHPHSETHEHMNLTVGINSYLMQFFRRRDCLFSTTTRTESTRPYKVRVLNPNMCVLNDLATTESLSFYVSYRSVWAHLYKNVK